MRLEPSFCIQQNCWWALGSARDKLAVASVTGPRPERFMLHQHRFSDCAHCAFSSVEKRAFEKKGGEGLTRIDAIGEGESGRLTMRHLPPVQAPQGIGGALARLARGLL